MERLCSGSCNVVSGASSSHAAGIALVRNYRGASRRSLAHKRNGLESVPELLTQLASRVAALKTLEGALLALMLNKRLANDDRRHLGSALMSAPDLAKLFDVPESWVREQARLGNLPSIKLGHYVRFRIEEVERFLAERAGQAA